jgi:hypothetical protein
MGWRRGGRQQDNSASLRAWTQKTATSHSPVDASVANPADAFFFVY